MAFLVTPTYLHTHTKTIKQIIMQHLCASCTLHIPHICIVSLCSYVIVLFSYHFYRELFISIHFWNESSDYIVWEWISVHIMLKTVEKLQNESMQTNFELIRIGIIYNLSNKRILWKFNLIHSERCQFDEYVRSQKTFPVDLCKCKLVWCNIQHWYRSIIFTPFTFHGHPSLWKSISFNLWLIIADSITDFPLWTISTWKSFVLFSTLEQIHKDNKPNFVSVWHIMFQSDFYPLGEMTKWQKQFYNSLIRLNSILLSSLPYIRQLDITWQ